MKAIVNTSDGKLELKELPAPEPGPGQVRVRTAVCGICATDLEIIDGSSRGRLPRILGHEWSGVVEKLGPGASQSLLGRRCVASNVLQDGGEVGFEHPGGYGELFLTEASNIQVLPDSFPMDVAALIEPLAVAVRGMRRLNPGKGPALIMGDGALGLLLLCLLKRSGVQDLVVLGGRSGRLALALELGASAVVDYHKHGAIPVEELARLGKGPFQTIVEASGAKSALDAAASFGAQGAKILLIGNYEGFKPEIRLQEFLHKELELIGSNASEGAWPESVKLAVEGSLPLKRLATHCFPVESFEEAMKAARADRSAVRVMMLWGQGAREGAAL